jgi:hypothetical protein
VNKNISNRTLRLYVGKSVTTRVAIEKALWQTSNCCILLKQHATAIYRRERFNEWLNELISETFARNVASHIDRLVTAWGDSWPLTQHDESVVMLRVHWTERTLEPDFIRFVFTPFGDASGVWRNPTQHYFTVKLAVSQA